MFLTFSDYHIQEVFGISEILHAANFGLLFGVLGAIIYEKTSFKNLPVLFNQHCFQLFPICSILGDILLPRIFEKSLKKLFRYISNL